MHKVRTSPRSARPSTLRTTSLRVLLAASAAAASALPACGSPPPPQAPPPKPAETVQAAATDVSAVPEPKDLALLGHFAKPSDAMRVLGSWGHTRMPDASEVTQMMTGESVGPAVDLGQPIDFAVAALPKGSGVRPLAAFSAAVPSLEDAKRAFAKFRLVPSDNGAFRIEGLGAARPGEGGDDDGDDDHGGGAHVCELAPAYGAASTRLVCGDSDAALGMLTPYLTRTATRATFPSDVHVELRLAPVRPVIEQQRRAIPLLLSALGLRTSGIPGASEAVSSAITDVIDFTNDADQITLDGTLAEPQGTLAIGGTFRTSTSFIARMAISHPEKADAPPPQFWKLPVDATYASFGRGVDAKDVAKPRERLVNLASGLLEKEGLAEADRKPLAQALEHTIDLLIAPSVSAQGADAAAAEKAVAAVHAAKPDTAARVEAERGALEKVGGYWLVGLDLPASQVTSVAKEWATAWSRPAVIKALRAEMKDTPPPTMKMVAVPKGLTLPKEATKDASQLEITLTRPREEAAAGAKGAKKAPPPAGKPLKVHLLVVPDGARTWLVASADEALAVDKAKGLLASADEATLARRAGLEKLKEARATSGGFLTARGLVGGSMLGWTFGQRYGALGGDVDSGLGGPQKGNDPIPFEVVSKAPGQGSPAGSFVATVNAPRAAIEDVIRGFAHAAAHR